jgi:hypothetical protein
LIGRDNSENCDRCEKYKRIAQGIYNNLRYKKLPDYLSGGNYGSDKRHYDSIKEKQNGLKTALKRTKNNCNPLPPEYPEWERVANIEIPILF